MRICRFIISLVSFICLSAPLQADTDQPVLSLVIDDLGYSFDLAKKVIDLPGKHTFAIIPGTTYAAKIARYAHSHKQEVMLHMPMQSSTDLIIEPTALHDKMTESEITDNVATMMNDIPHIAGVNNHMGSKLTEIPYIMRPVMETIRQSGRHLYFLDSRTTPLSTAYQQALIAGLPSLKRDVFIDYDHTNLESMKFQLDLWLDKAKENGHAVAIGHPYTSTINLLKEKIPQISTDYRFKSVSELVSKPKQEDRSWPRYLSHWLPGSRSSKQ